MGFNLNLLDQLFFYGKYHHNKWNQLIHFIFVPCIFWTIYVWFSYTPGFKPDIPAAKELPEVLSNALVLNASFFIALAYSTFYIALDFVAGLTWCTFMGLPMWLTATAFAQTVPHAWAWAIGLQAFSWYMQIHPGHAVLEKRKPALMESLAQAFALAPLFVWFELLFLLGYRPGLYRQLNERIEAELAQWRASREQLLKPQQ